MPEQPMLDIDGLAVHYGLFTADGKPNRQAIYWARHVGNCPPAMRIAGRLRWRHADVEAWDAARVETANPASP